MKLKSLKLALNCMDLVLEKNTQSNSLTNITPYSVMLGVTAGYNIQFGPSWTPSPSPAHGVAGYLTAYLGGAPIKILLGV